MDTRVASLPFTMMRSTECRVPEHISTSFCLTAAPGSFVNIMALGNLCKIHTDKHRRAYVRQTKSQRSLRLNNQVKYE